MGVSLPYLASNKNLLTLFEKIASAKVPSSFTQEFLQTTIGLKGSNDRPLIPLLRNLGFLDAANTPTNSYSLLKGERASAKKVLATGIANAYRPLFDADQSADKLPSERIKSLVAQVAGTDDAATARIASTFQALVKCADFSSPSAPTLATEPTHNENDEIETADTESASTQPKYKPKGFRPEFHYNIQIHLPANGTEESYLNIFNALRKTFQ